MFAISALDITRWSETQMARGLLPVLVRKLVTASNSTVQEIAFPAHEGVDAGGWDGELLAAAATTQVPAGRSFWELSCERRVRAKASRDFAKRTETTPPDLRASATFVFVTPRRWDQKARWLEQARQEGGWANVLAYDAESLSQWLETAAGPALWLHAQLGRPIGDLCSLEDYWKEWASATHPALTFDIFAQALEENRPAIDAFFASSLNGPLHIGADTRSEAAAFAASLLLQGAGGHEASSRSVVAKTPDGLQWLKSEAEPPLVLIADPGLEPLLGDLPLRTRVIIATDKASPDQTPPVLVQPLTWEAFHNAAVALRLSQGAADALDRESGRRITIIRRRLSTISGVRRPQWADAPDLANTLVGLALAGGWFWGRPGDRAVLAKLVGEPEDRVEAAIHRLALMEDAPIFFVGGAGGLISRHDALPALRHVLAPGLIDRFFQLCEEVLAADDPSLELPPDQRWMANIHDKERPHSGRLRHQLVETVVFLATADRPLADGLDAHQRAHSLVSRLFAGNDGAWMRLRDVLPGLAEAAPRAFLAAAVEGLPRQAEDGGIWQLIKPVDTRGFDEHLRIKPIWALDQLAWSLDHFTKVVEILAVLSERRLDDNLVTKPFSSLVSIFQPYEPPTNAPDELRVRVLQSLAGRFPRVAWRLSLNLVDQRLGHMRRSKRPTVAGEGSEAILTPTQPEAVRDAAAAIVLGRELDKVEALELIEKCGCFGGDNLAKLWDRVDAWQTQAEEKDRAAAQEAVRKFALRPQARNRGLRAAACRRAREIFDRLAPPGPAGLYAWLFQTAYIPSVEEIWGEHLDWPAQRDRTEAERGDAVRLLWAEGGHLALLKFARNVGCPAVVAASAGRAIPEFDLTLIAELLHQPPHSEWPARPDYLEGVFHGLDRSRRQDELEGLTTAWARQPERLLEVLLLAPAEPLTWAHLQSLPPETQSDYWRRASRFSLAEEPDVLARVCRELLAVDRPRAALGLVGGTPEKVDSELLVEILTTVSQVQGPEEDPLVDPNAIDQILQILDQRTDVEQDTILRLDFVYAQALEHTERGAAALHRELINNPEVFALALRSSYRRDDGTEEDVAPEEAAAAEQGALRWISALEHCRLSPGADKDGNVDPIRLTDWLARLASLLAADRRTDRGLRLVGRLLGENRRELNDVWPRMEVAEALEPFASDALCSGIMIGIISSRGGHRRSFLSGGGQERELAEKYRGWRRRLDVECPNLARAFEDIAENYDGHAKRHDEDARFRRAAIR